MTLTLARRAGRFYLVGALGLGVQLGALWAFRGLLNTPYLLAAALAVELAVLHNFLWHERWTWADRTPAAGCAGRLWRFHLSNGFLPLAVNLALMRLLAGEMGMHYLAAGTLGVAVCAVLNFSAAEWFVYRRRRPVPLDAGGGGA